MNLRRLFLLCKNNISTSRDWKKWPLVEMCRMIPCIGCTEICISKPVDMQTLVCCFFAGLHLYMQTYSSQWAVSLVLGMILDFYNLITKISQMFEIPFQNPFVGLFSGSLFFWSLLIVSLMTIKVPCILWIIIIILTYYCSDHYYCSLLLLQIRWLNYFCCCFMFLDIVYF